MLFCNGKLNLPWSGPHEVIEKLNDALYRVRLNTGDVIIFNVERLKKFYSRDIEAQVKSDTSPYSSDSESDDEPDLTEDNMDEVAVVPPGIQNQEVGNHDMVPGPIMKEGGRLWCNLDKKNIITGTRRTK